MFYKQSNICCIRVELSPKSQKCSLRASEIQKINNVVFERQKCKIKETNMDKNLVKKSQNESKEKNMEERVKHVVNKSKKCSIDSQKRYIKESIM